MKIVAHPGSIKRKRYLIDIGIGFLKDLSIVIMVGLSCLLLDFIMFYMRLFTGINLSYHIGKRGIAACAAVVFDQGYIAVCFSNDEVTRLSQNIHRPSINDIDD